MVLTILMMFFSDTLVSLTFSKVNELLSCKGPILKTVIYPLTYPATNTSLVSAKLSVLTELAVSIDAKTYKFLVFMAKTLLYYVPM